MSTARRIAKNTLALITSFLVQKILALLLIILIARKLGVENFGIYSFVFSFVLLFSAISDFGINSLVFRDIPQNKKKVRQILGSGIALKTITSLITIFLILFFVGLIGYKNELFLLIALASFSMIFDSFSELFRSVYLAFEKMELDFFYQLFSKGVLLALSFYVLFSGMGLTELIIAYFAASFFGLIFAMFLVLRQTGFPVIKFDYFALKKTFTFASPFFLIVLFSTIYSNIGVTLVGQISGMKETGVFSAAFRIVLAMGFLNIAFISSVFPVLSKFYAESNKSFSLLIVNSFRYIMVLVMPIVFGVIILSERIISLVYPSSYATASVVLKILVWFMLFNFVSYLFLFVLNSSKKEKSAGFFLGLTLVLSIFLNVVLIGMSGAVGASWALIISEFFFMVLCYLKIKGFVVIPFSVILKSLFKPLVASILMSLFILLIFSFNFFLIVPIAAVFYFAVLFFIKGFSKQDFVLLRRIIKR